MTGSVPASLAGDLMRAVAADVLQQARKARDVAVMQRDDLRDETESLLRAADAVLFALSDPELEELPVRSIADLQEAVRVVRNALQVLPARGELSRAGV